MRFPLFSFCFCLFACFQTPVLAATLYILDGGSGSGTAWNDALDTLPATLTRGNTYYIGDGSYAGYTFDDAASGTTLITVKKATEADHGTSTGWVSTMGDGVASFTGRIDINAPYIVFTGQTRSSPNTGHGFYINASASKGIQFNASGDNVSISYVEIEGRGLDGTGSPANDGIYCNAEASQVTVEYCYIYDMGRTCILGRYADDWTVQHNRFARNESTAGQHSEGISADQNTDRWIVRWNEWEDIDGTGIIVFSGDGWELYGNVCWRTGNPVYGSHGNGSFCTWSGYTVSNAKIYNNTFASITGKSGFSFGSGNDGNNNVARNNLWYNCENIINNGIDIDYSWSYLSTPEQGETHIQNGSSDPFVNSVAYDFHLSAQTNAGEVLFAPYNQDLDGVIRASYGTWDRGAYEFVPEVPGPTSTPVPTPTSTRTPTPGPTPTPTFTPVPENLTLLAHWEFENDLTDSADAHDGTQTNGTITYTDGAVGTAAVFDGNAYVTVAAAPDLNALSDEFSISLWVKISAAFDSADYVFYKGGLGEAGWYVRGHNDGGFLFKIFDGTNSRYDGLSSANIPLDTDIWQHMAMSVNNRVNLLFWINTQAQNIEFGNPIANVGSLVNSIQIKIGADKNGTNRFTGQLDDIRIYSGVFSDADVISLHNLAENSPGRRRGPNLDGGFEDSKGGIN